MSDVISVFQHHFPKEGCVFIDKLRGVHVHVGLDEDMCWFPDRMIKNLQELLEQLSNRPNGEFNIYFGSNPSNYPNYGSIHFSHLEMDERLTIHSTNGTLFFTTHVPYHPSKLILFFASILKMVNNYKMHKNEYVRCLETVEN